MNKIPENIKVIGSSVLPLIIILILFVIVGNFAFSKITDLRTQIGDAETVGNTLKQKVNLLSTVSGSVANYSSSAAVALPDSNTSLAVISQLKNLAILNTVLLSNIKAGSETKDPSGFSRTDVSFDVEGSRDQIVTFLKAISGIAPISLVGTVKISESGGLVRAGVGVRTFWAAIPKTLPTSNQSINDLTADERSLLSTINSLTPPSFSVAPASQGGGRPNPFVQ